MWQLEPIISKTNPFCTVLHILFFSSSCKKLPPKELLVIIDPFFSDPFFLNEVNFPKIEIQK